MPWTPEVGLCDLIRRDVAAHTQGIHAYTGITNLLISQASVSAHVGKTGKAQRDTCKAAVDALAAAVAQKRTWSDDRAREALFSYLVQATLLANPVVMKQISGKLFN
ncbi:MAG: hypothetical protein WCG13_16425 [Burkholderiales bacterium]